MRKAQQLDWSEDSAKAFVLIADDVPHAPSYTDQHIYWRDELDVLIGMGVKVRFTSPILNHDMIASFILAVLDVLIGMGLNIFLFGNSYRYKDDTHI